jgi:hypothetical protein
MMRKQDNSGRIFLLKLLQNPRWVSNVVIKGEHAHCYFMHKIFFAPALPLEEV